MSYWQWQSRQGCTTQYNEADAGGNERLQQIPLLSFYILPDDKLYRSMTLLKDIFFKYYELQITTLY